MKSLKKEYGLYDAYFKRSWGDNYAYIVLRTKDWDTMISDSLGNIIIPNTFPSQKKYTSILLAIKDVLSQKTKVAFTFS